MKDFIKNRLREDLEYYHADDANPEADSFRVGIEEHADKWGELERDITDAIRPIIEKHQGNFPPDSYAVIDAIQQVFDNMFQRV